MLISCWIRTEAQTQLHAKAATPTRQNLAPFLHSHKLWHSLQTSLVSHNSIDKTNSDSKCPRFGPLQYYHKRQREESNVAAKYTHLFLTCFSHLRSLLKINVDKFLILIIRQTKSSKLEHYVKMSDGTKIFVIKFQ